MLRTFTTRLCLEMPIFKNGTINQNSKKATFLTTFQNDSFDVMQPIKKSKSQNRPKTIPAFLLLAVLFITVFQNEKYFHIS